MLKPPGKRGLKLIKRDYVFIEGLLRRLFKVFMNKRLKRQEIPLTLKYHGIFIGMESATYHEINGFYRKSLIFTITEEINKGHAF